MKLTKKLSAKEEKQRCSMNVNHMQIGQLVFDGQNGIYSYIRGFTSPWIWVLESLESLEDGGYFPDFPERNYTEHFTNLFSVDRKFLYRKLKEGQAMTADARRIAKLAKIDLSKFGKQKMNLPSFVKYLRL